MSALLSTLRMRILLTLLILTSNVVASDLLVAAASDLTPLESALSLGFKKTSWLAVRFSFGASGLLLQQIQNGAPYDVYLSANQMFVDTGIRTGALASPGITYANGRIAIWSRRGRIDRIEQLLQPQFQRISIANPEHAPYGEAAREALEKAGLWSKLRWRIVYGENIRQALQFAETGNADAAIVSWTLVYDRGGVLIPETLHQPIHQSGAVVKTTHQRGAAERFLQFLRSAEGERILRQHGLFPPQSTAQ
jgi:molybdate transport system substrate-binding protein